MKLGVLVVTALVAFTLKRHYADAPSDALWWILAPTAHVAGFVSGATFTWVPGEGYLSIDRLFLIEKACAGINFMIAALAVVALALLHRVQSAGAGAAVVCISVLAGYSAAVIVNAARIVVALWIASHPVAASTLDPSEIHRLEGIAVYFAGLVLLHELVRRASGRTALAWFER
jgi:exosortase K